MEQALDDFQDAVLKVWERTAGTAFDLMVKFEDGFGAAVGVFSIAAVAPKMQAVPEVFKHLTTLDLADFKNAVMFASEHIKNIVQLGSSLMSAFASDVFDFFRNAAEGFIDAIMEVDVVMKLFKALETAYTTKITLPFGMPRTLQSKNFGRASCSAYENKYKRTNRYSGYKKFDILTPYYNNCKEKCPSTYDAVTGGKKCRAKCSHYGLSPHNILGIQEGCQKKSVKRPLKSLTITKKCDKKYGSSWYRSIPTDKCRQKCHSWKKNTFYGETYSYCTYKCPSGMSDKKNFKDKACTIPDSGKFDRSVMKASCSKYVTSSTPKLFLKDTGGCFEDCKSTE